MERFFNFAYKFFMNFFTSLLDLVVGFFTNLWNAINPIVYFNILNKESVSFMWYEWLFAILTILLVLAIVGIAIAILVLYIIYNVRRRRLRRQKNALIDQVDALNRRVKRLIEERDKLTASQIVNAGIIPPPGMDGGDSAPKKSGGRFAKLSEVDELYGGIPAKTEAVQDYDLPTLVHRFLGYANNTLKLYYNAETIRRFIAGMASSRLIILEGISGTGKTSLPYAWGKFLGRPTTIVPVQPSWRDKAELIGYFNEFTKRFNETDFLKSVYESTYRDDVGFIVLDEMNLARVEYYFASVLSILEMPNREEWTMEIVGDTWNDDPLHLTGGKIRFPANLWFVGTANQDDSTFTITDKVYDRAMTIQLNAKGKPFNIESFPPQQIALEHLEELFNAAKNKYQVSQETLDKFDKLDDFMISNFRLAFGNRILKQMLDFVPVYVACGGTELDGVDYILTYKILRKIEGLNLSFLQDNLKAAVAYIDELFGKKNMNESKNYLNGLIRGA